jgi:uncharacterized membrane protein YphA (DoxX/SURF4 family)
MKAAFWTITVLIGALFVFSGAMKLLARGQVVQLFAHWGYPAWLAMLVGAVELLAGIAIFVPGTRRLAAWVIIVLTLGSAVTHVRAAEYPSLIVNSLVLLGCIFTIRHRREIA